jgi:hypothetical protein
MPAGTMGLRTIWISLRAVNYTSQVFKDLIRDTKLLSETEAKLTKQTMMAGQHALSAGLMWTVLGQSIDDSITKHLTSIGVLQDVASATKPYIAALLTTLGVIQMLYGVEQMYIALKGSKLVTIYAEALAVNILASSWKTAFIAMGAATAIFFVLKDTLGTVPALLIAVAVAVGIMAVQLWIAAGAMSVLTWGLAAVAGGLAIAGAIAALGGIREFPMGTRMIERTGPVIAHKGEVIYNPATNRPTQVGNDMGRGAPSTTVFEMPINIEEMHTKSDFDDVDERLREGMRKVSRNQKR